MAVKGNAYVKTSWAFQERPVASAKLNQWDDRIEAALELIHYLLNLAWGGGSGVLRGAATDDLKVLATSPPTRAVTVQSGYAFIVKYPFALAQSTQTPAVAAPASHPRIDLVQARLAAWDIHVKTGTEAESPTPPGPDEDCIPLAHLYLRPGMTAIKDTDDATNGYIIDARTFL